MNFFFLEMKEAELARAQEQCLFLQAEYDKSTDTYDKHSDQSAFEYTMHSGTLLQKARSEVEVLEKEVAQAQRQLAAQDEEVEISPVLDEFSHVPFKTVAKYVCGGLVAMVCITVFLQLVLAT
jgi:hypothetical protein